MGEFHYSEREACKLMSMDRTTYRYKPRPDHNAELRSNLVALARQKPRYGYRRLCALLERSGCKASPQRVYRIYSAEHLALRRLKRKRLVRAAPEGTLLSRANQEWAIDFVSDGLATGRGLRMLTVVDSFTRECPAIEVDTGLSSRRVTRVLDWVIGQRGRPELIRCDNGPEFTSRHFLVWCEERYTRAQSLFRDLAMARADGSLRGLLARVSRIDVLVIDDWAMAPLSEPERRDLWEICEDRYQVRSTILTSQLPVARWHEQIGDPTLADGILDRLVHNAHRIEMRGDSMRKSRGKANT